MSTPSVGPGKICSKSPDGADEDRVLDCCQTRWLWTSRTWVAPTNPVVVDAAMVWHGLDNSWCDRDFETWNRPVGPDEPYCTIVAGYLL